MKRAIKICLTTLFFLPFFLNAADLTSENVSMKFGKVTLQELEMKVYDKDTSAVAVILNQQSNTNFTYKLTTGFYLTCETFRKIKILKQEGTDEGNISIPYYYKSIGEKESITGLEVSAYNLEDGKIVKTKLDREYLFDEEINNSYKQIKFSIPNVKVGTVIEYKYTRGSDNVYSMPDWNIQHDIPIMNSFYEVRIPEYFKYNIEQKGFETLKISESTDSESFLVSTDDPTNNSAFCSIRDIKCIGQDLPGLKNEDYLWCKDDYITGIRFELRGTNFPNTLYKSYANTWDELETTLKENTEFWTNMKITNPWKEEIKLISDSHSTEKEKIEKIYDFVKKNVRWNEIYSFFGENLNETLKNGVGDNAQINFLLMSALKDAGINNYPILISRRSLGRLPMTCPSLNSLNTFVVCAETSDSLFFYMDGSATYGGLNMLPEDLLVDKGRILNSMRANNWVDLSRITKNYHISNISASIDKEGKLIGNQTTVYTNQLAYKYKMNYLYAKDSAAFIESYQNSLHVNIDTLKIKWNETASNKITEQINFTRQLEKTGDRLYINPMIINHITVNEFTQTERKLPVEFSFPYSYQVVTTLNIPDNYQIEEMPKSVKIILSENKGVCQYSVEQKDKTLLLKYLFQLNEIIYPYANYSALRDFFGEVANKNSAIVVLKKI